MVAIVSLLDAVHSGKVQQIILELEREFGLKGVQATPYPHLTWLTANDGSLEDLKAALGRAAGICCRVTAQAMGLGIFPGAAPVLYIPILRTKAINHFHGQLYEAVSAISSEIGTFYQAKLWMPHLSLALGDTTPELVTQALLYLNHHTFTWEISLDNLTLLTKNGDQFLKDSEFPLLEDESVLLKISSLK